MSSEANLLDERGFSASLAERVGVLRSSVEALAQTPASSPSRARVQRRLHALGAAARTVGFLRMAVRICDVQSVLEAAEVVTAAEIDALVALMDDLPSLATKDALVTAGLPRLSDAEPIRVMVVGDAALEELLRPEKGGTTTIASARFDDPSQVWAALEDVPDAFVVDVDLPGARAFVAALIDDLRTELVPIMTIGRFETRDEIAHYVALGVTRTFTKPVAAAALRRACTDAIEQRRGHTIRIEMRAMTLPPPPVRREGTPPAIAAIAAPTTHAPATSAVRSPPPPGLFVGRRIIAADDDPAVAWFLSDLFRKMGCRADEALDGKAALARALDVDRTVPDLVVAALAMSDLDGAALVRTLRADPATRDVPILLQARKEEDLAAARRAGIDAALVDKGASPEELVAVAGTLLEPHARLRAKLRAGGSLAGTLAGAGVTVLRLLAMAQEMPRGLKLTIKDATFCHELLVLGGALRSVTRYADAGDAVAGPRAMATAIGTVSGSFTVETARDITASPLGVGFVVDAVHAARALSVAASGAHLANVAELRFDPDTARAVSSMTAERAAIAQRLVQGAAPRDLLARGQEDPVELESVLGEMCRRGLVTAVREEAPLREDAVPSLEVLATLSAAYTPAPAPVQESTLPLLLRRQRAMLSAPPPIVREASQPPPPVLAAAPIAVPLSVFVPIAAEERPRPPMPAPATLAPAPVALPEITDVEATAYACPEPSISVPIVFEEPQLSRPIATAGALVPVAPPAPIVPASPPALPLLLSPPPTMALVVRVETPPPPPARWTLSPPPGPSSLSLPPPPVAAGALEMPMPTFYPRDEGAAPPLSVTTPPPAPATKVRRSVALAALALALLAGAGVRWTLAAPARAAAAAPHPTAAPLPPQGLLEVAAADGTPIQIDGTPRGVGPKLSVSLSEGAHEVRTEGPNGKTRLVEIARGRVTHVDLAWRPAPVPPTR